MCTAEGKVFGCRIRKCDSHDRRCGEAEMKVIDYYCHRRSNASVVHVKKRGTLHEESEVDVSVSALISEGSMECEDNYPIEDDVSLVTGVHHDFTTYKPICECTECCIVTESLKNKRNGCK